MSLHEAALDVVCSQRDQIPVLLAVVIVMGLLLVFPFAFLERGSSGHVIAVIDAVLVVGCLVVFGGTYWYCTKRAME